MRTTIALAVAGALGVLSRHSIQSLISRHGAFPWATFIVNVSGAFAAGLLFTLIARRFSMPMWAQTAVFVGGYTTFSAMSLDAYLLLERGRYALLFAYTAGSVVAGVGAVVAGVRVGESLAAI